MQPCIRPASVETPVETLLERAVRRELARLDKIAFDQNRLRADKRPGHGPLVQGRVRDT